MLWALKYNKTWNNVVISVVLKKGRKKRSSRMSVGSSRQYGYSYTQADIAIIYQGGLWQHRRQYWHRLAKHIKNITLTTLNMGLLLQKIQLNLNLILFYPFWIYPWWMFYVVRSMLNEMLLTKMSTIP